jgi:proline dehydrogenase
MQALRSLDCKFPVCTLVLGSIGLMGNHLIYASLLPANHPITTKLTDTLKSITSNVSTSIQNDIDKVISDTMDITINNVMSQLSNATILENNDASSSQPQTPSSIDLSGVSLPESNEFASLEK